VSFHNLRCWKTALIVVIPSTP